MSYGHYLIPIQLQPRATGTVVYSDATASRTGDRFCWSPCQSPVILRYVNIISTSTEANTSAPKISVRKNTVAGAASTTGQQITTITMATGSTSGKVYYNSTRLDTLIEPDEELTLNVITAGVASSTIRASILVEPNWDVPGNLTMTAKTA